MKNSKIKLIVFIIIILGVSVCLLFSLQTNSISKPLHLIVEPLNDQDPELFKKEEIGVISGYQVAFYNTSNVLIEIGNKMYPLIDALQHNIVTVENVIAQAQLDAKDRNICREKFTSSFGCTTFLYEYNDFDIVYRNDVFKCANGQEYLLRDFIITPYGQGRNVQLGYSATQNGESLNLCFEDWGLRFSVLSAEATQITLECSQEDGQQADQLILQSYWIQPNDDSASKEDFNSPLINLEDIVIPTNNTTTLTICWSDKYNRLPSGSYNLFLSIREEYDPSQVHDLHVNYTDIQYYPISFNIP